MLGAIITLVVQIISGSLPFGALVGLCVIFGLKAVSHKKMDILHIFSCSIRRFIRNNAT